MPLLLNLMLRIAAVVLLCLTCAVGWVMVQAHRTIVADAATTAERVGTHMEAVFWHSLVWRDGMRKASIFPAPEWETLATLNLIAPGACITFAVPGEQPRKLCANVPMIGTTVPAWFRTLNTSAFGVFEPVRYALKSEGNNPVPLYATVDQDAAARLAWNHVSVVVGVAAVLALAIAVLVTLTIGHALTPTSAIVAGLGRMRAGDYASRVPHFQIAEFRHIGRAVNELAQRLASTTAERAALTKRLFEVQEEERRSIARDLHDEFGQCLSATSALASVIVAKTTSRDPAIAQDARTILRTQQRMMTGLRGTLARLRTQSINEIGLEASLRELISQYNVQCSPHTVFRIFTPHSLAAVPDQIAVGIYRIAQECLTNAVRHTTPTEVHLSVASNEDADELTVTVEDNGGGTASQLTEKTKGYGLSGIRERLAALEGRLDITNGAAGVRISATMPLNELTAGSLSQEAQEAA